MVSVTLGLVVAGLVLYRHSRQGTPIPPAAQEVSEAAAVDRHANAPRIAAVARSVEAPAPETPTNRNSIMRYLHGGEMPKLDPAQVEPFLEASRRSAGSLLAALRTTGDEKFLLEAMQKFPNDARVNYAAAFRHDATPEERRQALENLKQSDPNNALGNYLSAANYFKSGQKTEALQEMTAAAAKPGWQDYTADFVQNAEEAYRAAGYSEAEAKAVAASSAMLSDLAPIKSVGVNLVDLAKSYQQAGDPASAQAALQTALSLGQQVSGGPQQPIITTLVGIAVERMALSAMDPGAPFGNSGQTVQEHLNELIQQRTSVGALARQEEGFLGQMSDPEVANFYDRMKTFGPLPALQWAAAKYGTP